MREELCRLLEEASQIDGISGHEQAIGTWFKHQLEGHVDEVHRDVLGSVYGIKKSKNPKAFTLMVEGHLDEVGFMVEHLYDNGTLSIRPIGGWFAQNLLSSRVVVTSSKGEPFEGTIGSIPPHLLSPKQRQEPFPIEAMRVDLGFASKEDLLAHGIYPGNMVVLQGPYRRLSDHRVMAKAMDNRVSLVVMSLLAKALKDVDLPYHLVFSGCVQEEVGLRGATAMVERIKPDAAIVIDCSPANDAFGNKDVFGTLGQGALLRVLDGNYVAHSGFINYYKDVLDKHNLKYQYFMSNGGTDAGAIHKGFQGVLTLTACVCARYIHTPSSIVDLFDIEQVFQGLSFLLQDFDQASLNELQKIF